MLAQDAVRFLHSFHQESCGNKNSNYRNIFFSLDSNVDLLTKVLIEEEEILKYKAAYIIRSVNLMTAKHRNKASCGRESPSGGTRGLSLLRPFTCTQTLTHYRRGNIVCLTFLSCNISTFQTFFRFLHNRSETHQQLHFHHQSHVLVCSLPVDSKGSYLIDVLTMFVSMHRCSSCAQAHVGSEYMTSKTTSDIIGLRRQIQGSTPSWARGLLVPSNPTPESVALFFCRLYPRRFSS